MNTQIRITLFLLVFILSTVFFWNAINGYLLKSRAQLASDLQIFPHSKAITCNPKADCYLHIMGTTDEKNGLAGLSGAIKYGTSLKPDRIDIKGMCRTTSFGLDMPFQFKDNPEKRIVSFASGTTLKDTSLLGGTRCMVTVIFKPTEDFTQITTTQAQLTTDVPWKAGGTIAGKRGIFTPQIDSADIQITFDPQAPLPTEAPEPTKNPLPESCARDGGDCNCDRAVDLVDFEILRAAAQNEGASCDINDDSVTDAKDISEWVSKTDLFKSIE